MSFTDYGSFDDTVTTATTGTTGITATTGSISDFACQPDLGVDVGRDYKTSDVSYAKQPAVDNVRPLSVASVGQMLADIHQMGCLLSSAGSSASGVAMPEDHIRYLHQWMSQLVVGVGLRRADGNHHPINNCCAKEAAVATVATVATVAEPAKASAAGFVVLKSITLEEYWQLDATKKAIFMKVCPSQMNCPDENCVRIHGRWDTHQENEFKKPGNENKGFLGCRDQLFDGVCRRIACGYRHFAALPSPLTDVQKVCLLESYFNRPARTGDISAISQHTTPSSPNNIDNDSRHHHQHHHRPPPTNQHRTSFALNRTVRVYTVHHRPARPSRPPPQYSATQQSPTLVVPLQSISDKPLKMKVVYDGAQDGHPQPAQPAPPPSAYTPTSTACAQPAPTTKDATPQPQRQQNRAYSAPTHFTFNR